MFKWLLIGLQLVGSMFFNAFGFFRRNAAAFAIMAIAMLGSTSFGQSVLDTALATEADAAIVEGKATVVKAIPILGLLLLIGVGIKAFKRVAGR